MGEAAEATRDARAAMESFIVVTRSDNRLDLCGGFGGAVEAGRGSVEMPRTRFRRSRIFYVMCCAFFSYLMMFA